MNRLKLIVAVVTIVGTGIFLAVVSYTRGPIEPSVFAQATPTPPMAAPAFDQAAAIAALKEQIKGHENDPAPTVFKNIKFMTTTPAGRLLAVMQFGFSRSLGVDCTHCHVPGKWDLDEKPEKQIARDMSDMNTKINKELLRNIKNLKGPNPLINCTTCHRGQVKPALDLPAAK